MTTILTKALRAKLLENGQAQRAAIRNGSDDPQPIDPYPVVKLFTPDAGATWLLTELDPAALLAQLQQLEAKLGRERPVVRWGPRRIDLDLLVHGTATISQPGLELPHPGIAERAFARLKPVR